MGLLWDDDDDDISRIIIPSKSSRKSREDIEELAELKFERFMETFEFEGFMETFDFEVENCYKRAEERRRKKEEKRIRMEAEERRRNLEDILGRKCSYDFDNGKIRWKDVQELNEKTNTLKRRVQRKTIKMMKTIKMSSNTRDPTIRTHFDALPTIDPAVFVYYSNLLMPNFGGRELVYLTKQTCEILCSVFKELKYIEALVNTALPYAKLLSLVYVVLTFLPGLETKSGQEGVVLVSWFYKVIKLILWTCGDIEMNPGPHKNSTKGYVKIAAMRELTPILLKLIWKMPVMEKAPNGFYKDPSYIPAGFSKELLDPNNSKTLAKTKELKNQFYELVEYCNEMKIYIPAKYMIEIQAIQSNDSALLESCRVRRQIEKKFYECEQFAVNHGPEGINHLLKITENFNSLSRKQCDETVAEDQNNKRKREPKSNIEKNMKRLCTDSFNQKRNETVTSSNHIDPNPIQRVPDILNQTDGLNDTKEQTTSADSDPVVNDVSNMRNGDKLMATSENIDIDALLEEIQKEYDSSTMTSNECFSDGQQTVEVTTSAQADNPPTTSDANGGPGTKQACSSSKQGTNCDQNIPSNSDENNRISTDDLGIILFPDLNDILENLTF